MVINLWSATILIFIALSFFWSPQNPPTPCQMYKVAWSRVRRHQSRRVLWASCKQEPMESMALVPAQLPGLAYVGVFLIKSQYIKQNQSTNLFTAGAPSSVGEVWGKKPCLWEYSVEKKYRRLKNKRHFLKSESKPSHVAGKTEQSLFFRCK